MVFNEYKVSVWVRQRLICVYLCWELVRFMNDYRQQSFTLELKVFLQIHYLGGFDVPRLIDDPEIVAQKWKKKGTCPKVKLTKWFKWPSFNRK